jgi:hypothetical protein
MVPHREPFANERYLFGKYHDCGKYAELEKKFFSENEEIMREVFFDTNNLLGVDSDEDVEEDVTVKYEEFFSEIFSEEGQLRRDRIKEILETKIVRLSPVNLRVKMKKLWSGWRLPWSWRLSMSWRLPVWLLFLLALV